MGTRGWTLSTFVGCCLWILHGLGAAAVPVTTEGPFAERTASPVTEENEREWPGALVMGTVETTTAAAEAETAESILAGSPSNSTSSPRVELNSLVTVTSKYGTTAPALTNVTKPLYTSQNIERDSAAPAAATAAPAISTQHFTATPEADLSIIGATPSSPLGTTPFFEDVKEDILRAVTREGIEDLDLTTSTVSFPTTLPLTTAWVAQPTAADSPVGAGVAVLPSQELTTAGGAAEEGVILPVDIQSDASANFLNPNPELLTTQQDAAVSSATSITPEPTGERAAEGSPLDSVSENMGNAVKDEFSTASSSHLPLESLTVSGTVGNPEEHPLLPGQAVLSPAASLAANESGDENGQGAPGVSSEPPASALSPAVSEAPVAPKAAEDVATPLLAPEAPTEAQSGTNLLVPGTAVPRGDMGAVGLVKPSLHPISWQIPTGEQLLPSPTDTASAPEAIYPPSEAGNNTLPAADGTGTPASPDLGAAPGAPPSPSPEGTQPWGTAVGASQGVSGPGTDLSSTSDTSNPSYFAPEALAPPTAEIQDLGAQGAGGAAQAEGPGNGNPPAPGDGTGATSGVGQLSPPGLAPPNSAAGLEPDLSGAEGPVPLPGEPASAPGAAYPPSEAVDGAETPASPDLGAAPGAPPSPSLEGSQPWGTAVGASQGVSGPGTDLSSASDTSNPSSFAAEALAPPTAEIQGQGAQGAGGTAQAEGPGNGNPYAETQSDTNPSTISAQQDPANAGELPAGGAGALVNAELSPPSAPGDATEAARALGQVSPPGLAPPNSAAGLESDLPGAEGPEPLPGEPASAPGAAYPPSEAVDGAETPASPDLGAAPGAPPSPSPEGTQPWGTAVGASQGVNGPGTDLSSTSDTSNPSSFAAEALAPPTAGAQGLGAQGAGGAAQAEGPGNGSPPAPGDGTGATSGVGQLSPPGLAPPNSAAGLEPDLSGTEVSEPLPGEPASAPGAAYPPSEAVDGAETPASPDLGAAPGAPPSPSLQGSQPWGTAVGASQGVSGPGTDLSSASDTSNPLSFVPEGLAPPTAEIQGQGAQGAGGTAQAEGPGNGNPYAETQSDTNPSTISAQQDPANAGELPAGGAGALVNAELSPPSAPGDATEAARALGQVSPPGLAPPNSAAGLESDLPGAEGPEPLPDEPASAPGAAYPPSEGVSGAETPASPDLGAAPGEPASPSLEGTQPWGTAVGASQGVNGPGTDLSSTSDTSNPSSFAPEALAPPTAGVQGLGAQGAGGAAQAEGPGNGSPPAPGDGTGATSGVGQLSPPGLAPPNSAAGLEPDLSGAEVSEPLPGEPASAPGAAYPPSEAVDGAETPASPDLSAAPGISVSPPLQGSQPWGAAADALQGVGLPGANGPGSGSAASGPAGALPSVFGDQLGTNLGFPEAEGHGDSNKEQALEGAGTGIRFESSLSSTAGSEIAAGAGSSSGAASPSGVVASSSLSNPDSSSTLTGVGSAPGALQPSLDAGPRAFPAAEGAGEVPGDGGSLGQSQATAGQGVPVSGSLDGERGVVLQSASSSTSTEKSSTSGTVGNTTNGVGGAGSALSTSLGAAGPEQSLASAPGIQSGASLGLSDEKLSQVNVVDLPGGASVHEGPSPGASLGESTGAIIQTSSGTNVNTSPQEMQPLVPVAPDGSSVSDSTASSLAAPLPLPGHGLSSGLESSGSPHSSPSSQSGSRSLVPGAPGGLAGDAGGAQTWSLEDKVALGIPAPSRDTLPHIPVSPNTAPALPPAPQRDTAAAGTSASPGLPAPFLARESIAGPSAEGRGELGAAVLGEPTLPLAPHQPGSPGVPLGDADSPVPEEVSAVLPGAIAGRRDVVRLLPSTTGAGASVETPSHSPLEGNAGLPGLPATGITAGSPESKTSGTRPAGGLSPTALQPFSGRELTTLPKGAPATDGANPTAAFLGQGGAQGKPPTTVRPVVSCSPATASPTLPAQLPGVREVFTRPGAATAISHSSSPMFPAPPREPVAAPTPLPSPTAPAVPLYRYGVRENDQEYVERRVDFNSPLFKPETGFPFGKTLRDSLYFTDNGQIIFPASDNSIFTYPNPPPSGFNGYEEVPMIAVFWGNADFSRGIGTTFYQEFLTLNTAKPPFVRDVEEKIRRYLKSSYSAVWTLKITWEKAPAYTARTDTQRTITYQAILTTDGFRSYILMLYKDGGMQWDYSKLAANNVLIGYTSGDGFYRNDDLSKRPPAVKYRPDQFRGYNTDLRGLWIYKLETRAGINYRLKCLAWTGRQQEPQAWSQGLPACPCSLKQGQQDPRFKSSRRGWWAARVSMLHSAAPNQHGASVRCLYDSQGQLIEGRQERYWRSSRLASPYRDQELKLYDWCCNQAGSAHLCARYSEKRPKIGCEGYQSPGEAGFSEEVDSDSEEQRDGEDE